MTLARVLGALAVAAVVGLVSLVARYESARDAWRVHAAAIGTPSYDAAASDAAYGEVESALTWVERAARIAAAFVALAGIAIGRARRAPAPIVTRRRRARLVDACSIALVIAPSVVTWSSPGVAQAWTWLAPAFVIALLGGLAATGQTLGDRLAR